MWQLDESCKYYTKWKNLAIRGSWFAWFFIQEKSRIGKSRDKAIHEINKRKKFLEKERRSHWGCVMMSEGCRCPLMSRKFWEEGRRLSAVMALHWAVQFQLLTYCMNFISTIKHQWVRKQSYCHITTCQSTDQSLVWILSLDSTCS